jgi:hypothetical protein
LPVTGYQIQVQLPPNGNGSATATPTNFTVTSGGDGTAILGLRANMVQGGYSANCYGFVAPYTPCSIGLINTAPTGTPRASSLVVTAGASQTGEPNSTLPTPFEVTVKDQYGATFTGSFNVTFTAPTTGSRGTFAATGTNTQTVAAVAGVATASAFTLNATTGAFTVTVTGTGMSSVSIPVTIKIAAEVCTDPTAPLAANSYGPNHWQVTGTGGWIAPSTISYNYLNIGSTTGNDNTLVAEPMPTATMDAISVAAIITSIKFEDRSQWRRTGGSFDPSGNMIIWFSTPSTGPITSNYSESYGSDGSWVTRTRTWTTFTQPITGATVKNNLQACLRYNGSGGTDMSAVIQRSMLKVTICYINPDGSGGSVVLPFCEV